MGWEVKTGLTAKRSKTQLAKDYSIQMNGGKVVSRGLGAVNLPYGKTVKYFTGVVSILGNSNWWIP